MGFSPVNLLFVLWAMSATVSGVVVDEAGRPVADAEVWAGSTDRETQGWMTEVRAERLAAVTGPDGRFYVRSRPVRDWDTLLICRKGFVRSVVSSPARSIQVVLSPTVLFSGKVLDPQGGPMNGARVSAWLSGVPGGDVLFPEGPCPIGDLARSDAQGRFTLELRKPGWYDVRADADGYVGAILERVRIPSGEEAVLSLETGVVVEGRALTPEGNPVSGAKITMYAGADTVQAVSAADGSYRLPGVKPGSFSLSAEHPRYTGRLPVEIPAGGQRIDLVLHPREEVRGRVLGPEGEPIAGAVVSIVPDLSNDEPATTDADGSFHLICDLWDLSMLQVEKPGYATALSQLSTPVSEVEIRLVRGVSLTGRVLGLAPEDLARAIVYAGARTTAVDSEGRYRLQELAPGERTLYVRAGDRFLQQDGVILPSEASEVVQDLEFPPTSEVRGQVTSPEGEPLTNAEVLFYRIGRAAISAETGEDGTFSVRLEDGDYSATARLEGYFGTGANQGVTVSGVSVAGLGFQLQRGTTLSGRVLGIEPGEGQASITANTPANTLEGEIFDSVTSDQEGNYQISGMPPGTWKVEVVFYTPRGTQRMGQGSITLSPGEAEAFLDIELTTDLSEFPEEP